MTSNFQKNIKMKEVGVININTKNCEGGRHLWNWSIDQKPVPELGK